MKGFAKLVKNELIKIFAQKAYKILFIVMMVLFLLVPLINKGLTAMVESFDYGYSLEEEMKNNKSIADNSDDLLEKEYYFAKYNVLKLFFDNDMDYDSWQYSTMYSNYRDYYMTERLYYLLNNDLTTVEEVEDSYFSEYLIENIDESGYSFVYEKANKERLDYEKTILNADITGFYKMLHEDAIDIKKNFEGLLKQEKPNSLYGDKYQIKVLESAIDASDCYIRILKYLTDIKAEYGGWEYYSAVVANNAIAEISTMSPPSTKDEFEKNSFLYDDYESYDEYLEGWENELSEMIDVVTVLEYSVLNDVPTQSVQTSSSKSMFSYTVSSNIQYIMYFAIVLASLIVAKEFSSGTARLLFIRPHSRTKILMSKFASIGIVVVVLNVVNLLMSFIFTLIFNGVGDLFTSNLVITDGVVEETSAFWNLILNVFLANFRLVLLVSLAFLMSALCKKSALGIVVGMISDLILSSVYAVIVMISDFSVLKYTPLPYYQMEYLATSQTESLISSYFPMNINTVANSLFQSAGTDLNIWIGIGYYVLLIGVVVGATYLGFRKQEIKN